MQTTVACAPSRPIVASRTPLPIEPSTVIYLIGSRMFTPSQLRTVLLVGALGLMFILALLGGGLYTARALVTQPGPNSASAVLNTALLTTPSTSLAVPSTTFETPMPPTPIPTVIASGLSVVQHQDVNLRASPGSDQEKLAILRRGVRVLVLQDSQRVEDSIWVKVQEDQLVGWVNQRYLAHVDDTSAAASRARVVGVTPDSLRVRSEPSHEALVIDHLSEGSEVISLEMREDDGTTWQHIQIDQTDGWVDGAFLAQVP